MTLQHLGVLDHAVETADGDVHEAGDAVAKALADEVELDEVAYHPAFFYISEPRGSPCSRN